MYHPYRAPNLCHLTQGKPGLAARLTLGFYVSPSGLLPLCGREHYGR
jgi:hypothetical protein